MINNYQAFFLSRPRGFFFFFFWIMSNTDNCVDDVFADIRNRFALSARMKTCVENQVEDLRSANRLLAFRFSKLHSLLPSQLPALVKAPEVDAALADVRQALVALYQLTLVGPLGHPDGFNGARGTNQNPCAGHNNNLNAETETSSTTNNNHTQQQPSFSGITQAIYYFNQYHLTWESEVQESLHFVLLRHWLDAYTQGKSDLLITPEQAANVLGLQFAAKPGSSHELELRDATLLHVTIKEYLFAVLTLATELARLAFTSVMAISLASQQQQNQHQPPPTGSADDKKNIPIAVNAFLQNLQAAFLTINFKNDALRRRYDTLKYDVKNVERIVYDLCV